MPYFTFIMWQVVNLQIKLSICYLMMPVWMKGWVNSRFIAKFWWDVNIKSMQEEDFAKTWVGSLIIICNPNCEVKVSILAPPHDVLSCLYQFSDFTLKSPKTTIRNGLWLAISSRVNSRLSANWSNISVGWLGDRSKEMKLHSLFAMNT